jgi:hypothetical protein
MSDTSGSNPGELVKGSDTVESVEDDELHEQFKEVEELIAKSFVILNPEWDGIEIDVAKKWLLTELDSIDKGIAPETLEEEMAVVSDGSLTWNIDEILR